MIVGWLFPHRSARYETDATSCPLFNVKIWASCIVCLSSHAARKSRSHHHLNRSASCQSQWLVMLRFNFIHPFIWMSSYKRHRSRPMTLPQRKAGHIHYKRATGASVLYFFGYSFPLYFRRYKITKKEFMLQTF